MVVMDDKTDKIKVEQTRQVTPEKGKKKQKADRGMEAGLRSDAMQSSPT